MPKSIITGGAGFIGSHIADLLIEKGYEVVVVDNLSTGNKKNLNPEARFYKADIQSSKLSEIFKKEQPELVFHLAAHTDLRESIQNPILDAKTNILGSLNVLENAAECGARKVIFASTGGAIYGDVKMLPTPEEHIENPLSPYGVNKLSIEKSLLYYKQVRGLDYTIIRPSNVYGPRQSSDLENGVVAIFIEKLLHGEYPVINGHGRQTRDYVYVKDVAKAFVLAENKTQSDKFNISTGKETSVNQILDKITREMGVKAQKKHQESVQGEQKRSCLSYERAKNELKWSPEYDIDRGIQETVGWFRARE